METYTLEMYSVAEPYSVHGYINCRGNSSPAVSYTHAGGLYYWEAPMNANSIRICEIPIIIFIVCDASLWPPNRITIPHTWSQIIHSQNNTVNSSIVYYVIEYKN